MTNRDRAYLIAESAHQGQMYGVFPYICHLRETAQVAGDLGYDETIIIACVLHDILEDTSLSYNDIRNHFGEEVAEIVYCVTDELGRNRTERKEKTYPKIRSNWKATVVKVCDRIANIRHSAKYNTKMLEMYKKEHKTFCRELKCDSHLHSYADKAWKMLDELVIEKL